MWETKPAFVLLPFSSPSRSLGPKHDGCQIPSFELPHESEGFVYCRSEETKKKKIRPVTFLVSFQRRRCSSGTCQVQKEPLCLTVRQIEKSDLVSTQRG